MTEPTYYGIDDPLDRPPIVLAARKKKSREPYLQRIAPQHLIVLRALRAHGRSIASRMSFENQSYQLGARVSELRDAGCVQQDGHLAVEGRRIMVWVLTEKGERILRMAEAGEGLVEHLPLADEPPQPRMLAL